MRTAVVNFKIDSIRTTYVSLLVSESFPVDFRTHSKIRHDEIPLGFQVQLYPKPCQFFYLPHLTRIDCNLFDNFVAWNSCL